MAVKPFIRNFDIRRKRKDDTVCREDYGYWSNKWNVKAKELYYGSKPILTIDEELIRQHDYLALDPVQEDIYIENLYKHDIIGDFNHYEAHIGYLDVSTDRKYYWTNNLRVTTSTGSFKIWYNNIKGKDDIFIAFYTRKVLLPYRVWSTRKIDPKELHKLYKFPKGVKILPMSKELVLRLCDPRNIEGYGWAYHKVFTLIDHYVRKKKTKNQFEPYYPNK